MISFLLFCWYHCFLSLLGFHSIMEWLLVIDIWHEMCNNKSFYLSLASCSKLILLLRTTQEKKKRPRFSLCECCHQHQPELSVELLCIIFLGWLLNIVYLCNSGLAEKFPNVFQLGKLPFHRSIDSLKTTARMILYHPSFKVKEFAKKNVIISFLWPYKIALIPKSLLLYSHFHRGLAESPDQQQYCPYLERLWMEREGDMVNVNVNTKACHDILLPWMNTINKSEIKPTQTDRQFHYL